MGLNSYYYDGLQPKMSAGIINEHECMYCAKAYCLNIRYDVCTVFESENKGILFKKHQISYYLGLLGRKDP